MYSRIGAILAGAMGLAALSFAGLGAGRAAAAPSCSYLFYDATPDAPDSVSGAQTDDLDLVEGDFGLTPDRSRLRVVLTLRNLDKAVSPTTTANEYQLFWSYRPAGAGTSTLYGVDVQVDGSGTVTYTDGTEQATGTGSATTYSFTPNSASGATGSFAAGPMGRIEVDVPLKDIGSPQPGDVLGAAQAFTAQNNPVGGFIVDQDGPAIDYRLGQSTCLDPPSSPPAAAGHPAKPGVGSHPRKRRHPRKPASRRRPRQHRRHR